MWKTYENLAFLHHFSLETSGFPSRFLTYLEGVQRISGSFLQRLGKMIKPRKKKWRCTNNNWLVVSTILKNMKVNGKDYPIYYGK